ncbi:hypothetical protein BU23DRAFT_93603 [Bimuria novae-zelandiae CBS 107.79]|uniref:Uncharacterized protein n=1 Tax=Bimuria novae-zelandiae CBS 107.79 TaxID=1447943 RepID=A0A6A5UG98_9PLEO|nr:hypothetical protein BU23DRAFT_93603 [Bimuria novae-zelandiae CBS 107.79]
MHGSLAGRRIFGCLRKGSSAHVLTCGGASRVWLDIDALLARHTHIVGSFQARIVIAGIVRHRTELGQR